MPTATLVKLNLGAGELRMDGYVSVDLRPEVADVVADVTALPYEDASASVIVAHDLLEHFPAARTSAILAEWHRVLAPGGTLEVKVPNLYWLSKALIAYADTSNHRAVAALIRNVYGGHKWGEDGCLDTHHTGWIPATLFAALDAAGFDVTNADGEPNFTTEAIKR